MEVLHEAVDAVIDVLAHQEDWGHSGQRPDQYAFDVAADAAAVSVLHAGGLQVLSEESGVSGPDSDFNTDHETEPSASSGGVAAVSSGGVAAVSSGGVAAVIDPVDGSTNASRGVRYFATSICLVSNGAPLMAVIHDHGSGDRYEAVKGGGAFLNGVRMTARGISPRLEDALIAVNGTYPGNGGWAQFRTLGAASLELCYVAERRFDGYVDFSSGGLGPWDYLGALLVCREVGVEVRDSQGRDLVALDHKSRRTLVAASAPLVNELMEARSALVRRSSS